MNVVVQRLLEDAKREGIAAAFANRKNEVHAYLAPSDEPLSYDTKGVMRLDVAIQTLQVATARVALRALPGFFRQKVDVLKRQAAEFAAARVAGFILIQALKRALAIAIFVFEFFQMVKLQTELESAIRRGVLRTMREVPKLKMAAKVKKPRTRKRVASRHP